jgi:hypothetical protein
MIMLSAMRRLCSLLVLLLLSLLLLLQLCSSVSNIAAVVVTAMGNGQRDRHMAIYDAYERT